ncbi:uncharacterized protein LOC143884401 [Tasmannia lanceolata]|uniref:uncharacterized protein LOC143884401 n=1 Tax=Tasmannia lanceolata TaxID=3420 RepID=UPI004063DD35
MSKVERSWDLRAGHSTSWLENCSQSLEQLGSVFGLNIATRAPNELEFRSFSEYSYFFKVERSWDLRAGHSTSWLENCSQSLEQLGSVFGLNIATRAPNELEFRSFSEYSYFFKVERSWDLRAGHSTSWLENCSQSLEQLGSVFGLNIATRAPNELEFRSFSEYSYFFKGKPSMAH